MAEWMNEETLEAEKALNKARERYYELAKPNFINYLKTEFQEISKDISKIRIYWESQYDDEGGSNNYISSIDFQDSDGESIEIPHEVIRREKSTYGDNEYNVYADEEANSLIHEYSSEIEDLFGDYDLTINFITGEIE